MEAPVGKIPRFFLPNSPTGKVLSGEGEKAVNAVALRKKAKTYSS